MRKASTLHTYRKTQVLTASPAELMMLLYNGAVCFCDQARACCDAGRYEEAYRLLVKTENIVMELSAGLRRDVFPELVDNLGRLFEFVFYKLFEANVSHNAQCIDEAANVLVILRDAWAQAVDEEKPAPVNPGERLLKMISSVPQFVGLDGSRYGPFKPGETVSIPEKEGELLLKRNLAVEE